MIIVFDVGNTETTVGLFDEAELRAHWRIMTDVPRTADELGVLLHSLLDGDGVDRSDVVDAAIGSVVPRMTAPLTGACERWLHAKRITVIDGASPLPIRLDVEEPRTVGADRIVNTLAASRIFRRDAIVVDLGTATTFDCITADGVFLGGVIAAGVLVMAETLFRRTSKLPATELVPPKQVIGKNTSECIRAGVMLGAAELIDGLVRRLKAAWPGTQTPLVVATGGLAETFAQLCESFDRVEPYLTLHGLRMAHALLVRGAAD
ncbi:MAG: type III pantothenate kinase [Gemmatimonadota bacterium]|nr:type III pantothenate kinase [Gemmatimonadota bacterium]